MKSVKNQILVTGSNGQLGKSLQDIALYYPQFDFIFTTKKELDITKPQQIAAFFHERAISFCINCAAYTQVDQAEGEPEKAFEINAEAVKYLALACKAHNTTLIHISTDYVFDGTKRTPYKTTDPVNPINVYGKSKLLGEKYIQNTLRPHYIIRTSWLYHKQHGKNFYKTILDKAKNGESLKITGSQTGCPTNASNLAKFIMKLILDEEAYGIFHFCDEVPMTWYDFALKILEENGLKNETNIIKQDFETLASRPTFSVLNTTGK
jgi:dTDP-4-dehydrorhamnose reductase